MQAGLWIGRRRVLGRIPGEQKAPDCGLYFLEYSPESRLDTISFLSVLNLVALSPTPEHPGKRMAAAGQELIALIDMPIRELVTSAIG